MKVKWETVINSDVINPRISFINVEIHVGFSELFVLWIGAYRSMFNDAKKEVFFIFLFFHALIKLYVH